MKILILTPEIHFHAPLVLKKLFEATSEKDFEFLVAVTPKMQTKSKSSSLRGIIKNSGFHYFLLMVLMKIKYDLCAFLENIFSKPWKEKRFLSPEKVCHHYNVRQIRFEDINSDEAERRIADFSPDFILSIFFNQILKRKILSIPSKACINLHPSFLPEFKGMSPVLWSMSENSSYGGATLHLMDEKVDNGAIISQKKFTVDRDDSFFNIYTKAALNGADLVIAFFDKGGDISEAGDQKEDNTKFYGPINRKALSQVLKTRSFLKF